MSRAPFLILNIPRENEGEIVYRELDPQASEQWENPWTKCESEPQIREYFYGDYSKEFHKYVSEQGFDLRYEFYEAEWGKILKRIKVFEDDNEIDSTQGFNANIAQLIKDIVGKLGSCVLERRLNYKKQRVSANDIGAVSDEKTSA